MKINNVVALIAGSQLSSQMGRWESAQSWHHLKCHRSSRGSPKRKKRKKSAVLVGFFWNVFLLSGQSLKVLYKCWLLIQTKSEFWTGRYGLGAFNKGRENSAKPGLISKVKYSLSRLLHSKLSRWLFFSPCRWILFQCHVIALQPRCCVGLK